jgi:CRP-like cAMP-binding protein
MLNETLQNIPIADPMTNQILSMLPAKEYGQMLSLLEPVSFTFGEILYQPSDLIENVYFPISGIVSLLSSSERNTQMSIAMIGREGIIGLPAFHRIGVLGYQAVVTIEGSALKMKTIDFLDSCESGGVLHGLLQRYANLTITRMSQLLVCSRFHPIESQTVCWLLMTHDRIQQNELPVRQADTAKLLGMRREAITLIMGKLRKQQLISYKHGLLTIVNRAGIEAIACPCYGIIKAEEESFLG